MSVSFKTFLYEGTDYSDDASEKNELVYKQLTLDEIIKHLQTGFSDCAWMVQINLPFYRGEPKYVTDAYAMTDSSKGKRVSQNTSNFYTLILDNHPGRKQFPKRSASLICTTSERTARGYDNHPLRVIPGNAAKIGFVNEPDMWHTNISIFGDTFKIENLNSRWQRLGLSENNWNDWKKFDKKLKSGDPDSVKKFMDVFSYADEGDEKVFLESILKAYSATETGHTYHAAKNLSSSMFAKNTEVWIGGPCLVVHEHAWEQLRDAFGVEQ
jgi:hypothetical protein